MISLKKVGKVFQTIALFFFSFLLALYIPFYVTFLTIRIEVKHGVIENSIDKLDLVYVWENSQDYSNKLNNIVTILKDTGLPQEIVIEMIKGDSVKKFLKNRVSISVDYFLYKKKLNEITTEQLLKVIENGTTEAIYNLKKHQINIDDIFNEEQQNLFYTKLELIIPQILKEVPKVEEIIEAKLKEPILRNIPEEVSSLELRYNNFLSFIRFFFSYRAVVISTETILFLVLIVLGLNRFKRNSLKWIGGSLLLANICSILIRTFGLNRIDQIKTPFSLIPAQNYIINQSEKLFIGLNYLILFLAVIALGTYFWSYFYSKKHRQNNRNN